MKVSILNNIPSHYRRFLFDQIYQIFKDRNVVFNVIYLSKSEVVRNWSELELKPYEKILPVIFQGRNKRTVTSDYIINYGYLSDILKPDLVIFFGYSYTTYLVSAFARLLLNKKNVLFCESTSLETNRSAIVNFFKGVLVRCIFDRYIVPGQASFEYLKSFGINESKIDIAVNSSDLRPNSNYLDNRGYRPLNHKVSRFLYVGRIAKEKNILEVVNVLKKTNWEFSFDLVGDGPEVSELNDIIYQDDRFNYIGRMNPQDLQQVYLKNDILILPSLSESWGLVVNEGVNHGLAILVSNRVGCRHELVQGNGFVFDVDDSTDFLVKFKYLMMDPCLFQRASIKLSNSYTARNQAESFYKAILK